jgi:sortase A
MRSATLETIEVPAPPLTRLARWCSAAGMAAVVALALGGLTLIAQGFYIHAKAMLAQILLERAFAQALSTGTPVKPWSWADTWPVARVVVPRLGKSAIVLAGASGQALAFGPGQLERTPEIGEEGTAIYAAHRDTHFAFLADVRVGDHVEVTRRDGKVFRFRVTGASVVRFDHSGIDPYSSGRRLVLSTCWPLNARTQGPLRFVVNAELIETPSLGVLPAQAGNQNHRGL